MMKFSKYALDFKRPAIIAALFLGLAACTPVGVVVGAGATVGVAAVQERGIKGGASDLKIQAAVLDQFIKNDLKLTSTIGTEVYDGRVLLTGSTTNVKLADQAVKLAWKVEGVKDVINEIQVDRDGALGDYAQDSWITVQLKSTLTFDKDVLAVNYAIKTVNGVVYLIGIAQDQKELDRVIAQANKIKFVRKVVSHVRIKTPEPGAS
ncbi:MAG: BON domain-containing protein [Proteobacteria bacterium]|nr:BON domain-containing protein [Pseudomonadota bacterium]